jgi:hypothetical protein
LGDYDTDGSGGNCDEDSQAGTQSVGGCKGTSNVFQQTLKTQCCFTPSVTGRWRLEEPSKLQATAPESQITTRNPEPCRWGGPQPGPLCYTVNGLKPVLRDVKELLKAAHGSSGHHGHSSGLLTHGLGLKQRVLRPRNGTGIW